MVEVLQYRSFHLTRGFSILHSFPTPHLLLSRWFLRPTLTRFRERLRKTLRGVDGNSGDGLGVESTKMSFIAGEEGLAAVLDRGGEDRSLFFRQKQSEGRGRKSGRTRVLQAMASITLQLVQAMPRLSFRA